MKIYLAGPDVFRKNAKQHGERLKALCKEADHVGLYPLDNEITPPDSLRIFNANFNMIKESDVVLANIIPFRGPSADVGTAWEMGAAKALEKQVVAYSADPWDYKDREFDCAFDFPSIEDFGLQDNLMLIHGSDGVYTSFINALESLNGA